MCFLSDNSILCNFSRNQPAGQKQGRVEKKKKKSKNEVVVPTKKKKDSSHSSRSYCHANLQRDLSSLEEGCPKALPGPSSPPPLFPRLRVWKWHESACQTPRGRELGLGAGWVKFGCAPEQEVCGEGGRDGGMEEGWKDGGGMEEGWKNGGGTE